MENNNKNLILALCLAIVFILISLSYYLRAENKRENFVKDQAETTTQESESLKNVNKSVLEKNNESHMLLGDRSKYINLSNTEKKVVDQYYASMMKGYEEYMKETPIEGCLLKYYSEDIVLIGCAVPKPSLYLSVYSQKQGISLDTGNKYIDLWSGYLENENYIMAAGLDDINYFKIGDKSISKLENSKLDTGETYIKTSGMAPAYNLSFDQNTKVLKISVYNKNVQSDKPGPGYGENLFLRDVEYRLP